MENGQASAAKSGEFKQKVNLIVFLGETVSMPLEMLGHRGIGCRYARLRALFSAVFIVLFAMLFAARQPVWPLMLFLTLYWGRCIVHGVIWQIRLYRREPLPDDTTYCPGYPLIARLMPGRSQEEARWAEVGIVFAAGFLISLINIPLGAYLVFASFGLCLTLYLRYQAVLNKILDMHDAVVVQKSIAEGYRERSGG